MRIGGYYNPKPSGGSSSGGSGLVSAVTAEPAAPSSGGILYAIRDGLYYKDSEGNASTIVAPQLITLLHFDADLTDLNGREWTAHGGASISTEEKRFGRACLYLDGVDSYISTAAHGDFTFRTADFTIDWWIKYLAISAPSGSIFTSQDSYCPLNLGWVENSGVLGILASNGSGWSLFDSDGLGAWPELNTWVHYAVTRKNNIFRGFKNGVKQSETESSISLPDYASRICIGHRDTRYVQAYIDEFHVARGAKWTEDFTPPEAAYFAA